MYGGLEAALTRYVGVRSWCVYGGLEAALTRYVGWGVGVCMGDWRQPSLGMWGGELVCVWGTGGSPH